MTTPLLQPVISPILVGRDEYLAALDALAARVQAGSGVTLLVSGEAGIGKSRLVAEARTRFAIEWGSRVLQGNCFEHDVGLPYAPIVDLMRGLKEQRPEDLAALLDVAPELVVLLPELAGQPGLPAPVQIDPEQDKRRIQEAFQRSITTLAAEQPLLVVIEDIHWADDLSLELLQRLAQRITGQPLFLIVTWRNDEVSERLNHFLAAIDRNRVGTELRLERLTTREIETMLRAIFDQPQPIRPDFLQTIASLTDGNPFFIEEVVGALIAAGDIYRLNGAWTRKEMTELQIPRSVIDAVQQRARGLSGIARRLLDLAAVYGQRFDVNAVQELLAIDDTALLGAIRELIDAWLIIEVSDEHFAFRHALTREAIYASLLARERRTLHLALAEWIERRHADMLDPFVADLSYHYHAANAWGQTLEYARRAADRTRMVFAPASEIEHVDRALNAIAGLSIAPSRDLYRQRALANVTLGQFEQAERDHDTALDLARQAGDREAEWQSLLDMGALWSGRDYARTGDWFQQALDLARDIGDQSIVAQNLVQLGNWQVNTERPGEAECSLTAALAIFEAAGDRQRIAVTLDLLGIVADIAGDVVLMRDYLARAAALYRDTGDRRGLASALATFTCAAMSVIFEAAVTPAGLVVAEEVAFAEEALAISRDIGWRSGEAYAWLDLALLHRDRGELGRAIETATIGASIAEEIEHREWMTLACHVLGVLNHDLLDLPRARETMERAVVLARQSGSLHFLHLTSGAAISVSIRAGDLGWARTLSRMLDADLPHVTVGQRSVWLARGQLALAEGDPERAVLIAERLLATARHLTNEANMPIVARLRGEALAAIGRSADAERSLRAAIEGATSRNIRPLLWQLHIALTQLLTAMGRDADAGQHASEAREIIYGIAATIPESSRRDAFQRQALAMLPAADVPIHPPARQALTRREQEVAQHVARGLTNREIADALFVGERTVETHVGNILGKLGFSSRAQIAVWVVESGQHSPS